MCPHSGEKYFICFFMCRQNVFTQRFHHLKVSTAGRPIYYVSAKREVFTPMKLPKYTLPKVTTIPADLN